MNENWENIIAVISNLEKGLEVGGPTPLFRENWNFPLYNKIKKLDGINLKDFNMWQTDFKDKYSDLNIIFGEQYFYDLLYYKLPKKIKYDYVITSNIIEHMANPIKFIKNISDNTDYILSLIPYYKETFDRKRECTKIEHIIEDYINDVMEDDITHIDDAINNFDLSWGGDYNSYLNYSKENYKYRYIHQHCFDKENVSKMFQYCGYDIIYNYIYHNNIVIFCKKK